VETTHWAAIDSKVKLKLHQVAEQNAERQADRLPKPIKIEINRGLSPIIFISI
jgi:hypothetical protein